MKRNINSIYLLLCFAVLTACAQLGLQPAQSFDQKLGYAAASATSIRISAAAALDAKTIEVEDAENVLKLTD